MRLSSAVAGVTLLCGVSEAFSLSSLWGGGDQPQDQEITKTKDQPQDQEITKTKDQPHEDERLNAYTQKKALREARAEKQKERRKKKRAAVKEEPEEKPLTGFERIATILDEDGNKVEAPEEEEAEEKEPVDWTPRAGDSETADVPVTLHHPDMKI